jgi:hypothetical protein
MADFNTSKQDGQGNTVAAAEWNQLADVDNFTTSAGLTPSTTNLNQLGISSARYSSAGNYFTDSGTANAYVLSSVSPFNSPVSATAGEGYFVGMKIRFRAGNANTGSSTVNVNSAGVKNLVLEDGSTALPAGIISTTADSLFRYDGTSFRIVRGNLATNSVRGISFLPNLISVANNAGLPNDTIDFGAGVFTTTSGVQHLVPAISKKIQSSGSWTAGTGQNGLDTAARASNTFYRTYIIQNNSTLAYDVLFSTSYLTPTVPSGYTNLGLLDYAIIRVNGSTNIAASKWHTNDKRLVLGANESIQVFSGGATGAGSATILSTTEPLEFVVRLYLSTASAGGSDITVYGNEQSSADYNDAVVATTNNGFSVAGNGSVYTSDGKIYWKNFSTAGGVSNQTCKIKSIKIRS